MNAQGTLLALCCSVAPPSCVMPSLCLCLRPINPVILQLAKHSASPMTMNPSGAPLSDAESLLYLSFCLSA